jgi:hypothetical protein
MLRLRDGHAVARHHDAGARVHEDHRGIVGCVALGGALLAAGCGRRPATAAPR